MKNSSRIIVPLVAAMLLSSCEGDRGLKTAEPSAIEPATAVLDRHMAFFDRKNAPGCSIVLTNQGDILAAEAYGMANLDYDIPLSTDTTFRIASVSKQFTAMAVMLLEHDGKLSLDEDIHTYIPELPDYGHKVTLRHMLEHSSGLPTYDDAGYHVGSVPDYIREVGR